MIKHEQLAYDEWLIKNQVMLEQNYEIIDSDISYDEFIQCEYNKDLEYASTPIYETFDEWLDGNRTKLEQHFKDKNITDVDKMSEILYYEYISYVHLHGLIYTLTIDNILPIDIKNKLFKE